MTKTIKIPKDDNILGLGKVEGYDDDLILDEASQEAMTLGSEDVSDYEGDPKRAPTSLYFGKDRCLKLFQLKGDAESEIFRVCGGPADCIRKGHRHMDKQGQEGVYDTIKTLTYVDGLLHTWRTRSEQAVWDAENKAILDEATGCLIESKAYRDQLWQVEAEMTEDGEEDTIYASVDREDARDPDY